MLNSHPKATKDQTCQLQKETALHLSPYLQLQWPLRLPEPSPFPLREEHAPDYSIPSEQQSPLSASPQTMPSQQCPADGSPTRLVGGGVPFPWGSQAPLTPVPPSPHPQGLGRPDRWTGGHRAEGCRGKCKEPPALQPPPGTNSTTPASSLPLVPALLLLPAETLIPLDRSKAQCPEA